MVLIFNQILILIFFKLLFLLFACLLSAQEKLSFDSLKLKDVQSFFVDDYGSIYLYKNKEFSLTKYDSLGKQQGRLMLALPFKIQNVQNPLNVVLFSENAQEIKLIDQSLNEIQRLKLSQFGFIKMAYVEDLQQIWLLDDSMKRLVQYNFREDKIINSFALNFNFDEAKDMLVYNNRLYLISNEKLWIYHFSSEKIISKPLEKAIKLRRENDKIYIISNHKIQFLREEELVLIFENSDARLVDKNANAFYEVKNNHIYIQKIKSQKSPK